ncbi:MAG: orotidine 5'-phosphate decarboxylase [Candidatus Verstraetearchaeota archaeon]|jgi:orotidine-5'-phosphate decarboxylase|nr:orotidine 5'-phosphate decarboxylase [Candidatus Verstraetearchaeota archaeon]
MKIKRDKSIIISCDIESINDLIRIVSQTYDIEEVSGYKIGLSLALRYGLPYVVSEIRKITEKSIIYDHQKGGTDVHHISKIFSNILKTSNIDYAILFPLCGPSSETSWIEALKEVGITPIVGAIMTISDFLSSNGGFIDDDAPLKIFKIAAQLGVKDFVLPGNNYQILEKYKKEIDTIVDSPIYYIPGIGEQGGEITICSKIMKKRWHAIIGRSIYKSEDIRSTVINFTKLIQA